MFQKVSNVKEEVNWYKGQINDELEKIIGGATGQIPARMLTIYKQAWEKAEEQKNWPEYVYLLIKCGDSHIEHPDLDKKPATEEDLDGLVKRWTEYYSMAAMFYAAARVIAEKHECIESFAPGLFQEKLELVAKYFIKQECQKAKATLTLNYAPYVVKLKEIRQELSITVNNPNISAKDLLAGITQNYKNIAANMLMECQAVMSKAPCKYAVVGIGSMSRNEMGPFSDVEWGIILEDDSPKAKAYAYQLMCLLELKIISIGETELPRKLGVELKNGFGIDVGGNTPTHKLELLGTVEELVKRQIPVNRGGDVITLNALRTVCLIEGNEKLVNGYRAQLAIKLDERYQISKTNTAMQSIREGRAIQLFQADVYDFEPVLGKEKEEEQFNIKKELYRLPSNLVNYLSLYYGIEAQSSWDKLDKLVEGGFITEEAHKNIKNLIDFATRMRVKTHIYYGYEKEDVYLEREDEEGYQTHQVWDVNKNKYIPARIYEYYGDPDKQLRKDGKGFKRSPYAYEVNEEEQKRLELCYRVLIPIHRGIKGFIDKNAPKDFRGLTLYEDSLYVQGEAAAKMSRYNEAISVYEKALSLNPENLEVLLAVIKNKTILITEDSLEFARNILKLTIKKFGDEQPEVVMPLIYIARVLQAQGKYKDAMSHLFMAFDIMRKLMTLAIAESKDKDINFFTDLFPRFASMLFENMASILHDQDRNEEAIERILTLLAITEKANGLRPLDLARTYSNIGVLLCEQNRHEEALEYHLKAIVIYEEAYGREHSEVALSYNNIGMVLSNQGKYEEAMDYYLRSLAIHEKVNGLKHLDVAILYNNIGLLLGHQHKYEEAIGYLFKSLAIKEDTYGREHPDIALSYNVIGGILKAQNKYEKAMEYFLKSLAIKEKVYGPDHPNMALPYNNIGVLLHNQRKYEEATEYYLKSLAIREKAHDLDRPDVAESYNNIALILDQQGRHEEAMNCFLKSLAILEKIHGPTHQNIANLCNNIGDKLRTQGKYEEAMKYFFKALVVDEKVNDQKHPYIAITYKNIGRLLQDQGKYEEAMEYHLRAVAIHEKMYGPQHQNIIVAYNTIGLMLNEQGNDEEAKKYFNKALAIAMKYHGDDHPLTKQLQQQRARELVFKSYVTGENILKTIKSYEKIIKELLSKGQYNKALNYFEQVLELRIKRFGREHPEVAATYNNIGMMVYLPQSKYEEAVQYVKQGLEIIDQFLPEGHPRIIACYTNICCILRKQGNYEGALQYDYKILEIRKKCYGEEDPEIIESYNSIFSVLFFQGKYKEALQYAKQELKLREKIYGADHPLTIQCKISIENFIKHYITNNMTIDNENASEDSKLNIDDKVEVIIVNNTNTPSIITGSARDIEKVITIEQPYPLLNKEDSGTALSTNLVVIKQEQQSIINTSSPEILKESPRYIQQIQSRRVSTASDEEAKINPHKEKGWCNNCCIVM